MRRLAWAGVCAAMVSMTAWPVLAQDKVYVDIPGIPGESVDAAHVGWIDAYGVSHDSGLTVTFGGGGGGTNVGPPDLQPVYLLKGTDLSSPLLQQKLDTGMALTGSVTIEVCREPDGGAQECYYTVVLSQVYVVSIRLSGSSCIDPLTSCVPAQTESVGLDYGEVQYTYRSFSAGKVDQTRCSCWSRVTASTCSCP